jgi:hypothetical protein
MSENKWIEFVKNVVAKIFGVNMKLVFCDHLTENKTKRIFIINRIHSKMTKNMLIVLRRKVEIS